MRNKCNATLFSENLSALIITQGCSSTRAFLSLYMKQYARNDKRIACSVPNTIAAV